jgi:DNA-binding XRE family transcriptional regulator
MTPAEFRDARKALGLTQAAWGLSLGIGREHVAKIETGRVPVSATLAILARLLVERHQEAQRIAPREA